MTLRQFDEFKDLADVKKMHRDIKNNLTFDDLNVGKLSTDAPTTSTLDKGKFRLVEISGVPFLYYRAVDGTIYKKQMDAA